MTLPRRPIIVTRPGLAEGILDTIVELAYETIKRREAFRKQGAVLAPMPKEDQVVRYLTEHRRRRGLDDYYLEPDKPGRSD